MLPVIWTKGYLSRSLSAPGAGGRVTHKHSSWARPTCTCSSVCVRARASCYPHPHHHHRAASSSSASSSSAKQQVHARARAHQYTFERGPRQGIALASASCCRRRHGPFAKRHREAISMHSRQSACTWHRPFAERQSACTRGNQHALGIVHSQRAHRQADGGKVRKRLRLAVFRTAHLLLLLAIIEVRAHVDSNLLVV